MGLFNYSSKLSDEQLRRISLSAQYQGQQGGDHFTLSSKIGSRAKLLLEQGWGITNRQELCDSIEELLGRCRSLDIAVIKEEMMAEVQEDNTFQEDQQEELNDFFATISRVLKKNETLNV